MPPVILRHLNRDSIMSPRASAFPVAALVASLALLACNDAGVLPSATDDPAHAVAVDASLLAALGDARERVVPTLDADIQSPLSNALGELQSALDAGQLNRSRLAIATARGLLASHADVSDGDLADLASVGVLLMAVDEAVK